MRDFMIGMAILLGLVLSIQFYLKVDEINKHLVNIEAYNHIIAGDLDKLVERTNALDLIPGVGTDGRKP